MWWRALSIRLTWNDALGVCQKPTHVSDLNAVRNLFPREPDRMLENQNVRSFLESGILGQLPALLALLIQRYLPIYEQYAINASKHAEVVYVETNRHDVFLSCFVGTRFIVGRLSESETEFLISSCYILLNPEQKKARHPGEIDLGTPHGVTPPEFGVNFPVEARLPPSVECGYGNGSDKR